MEYDKCKEDTSYYFGNLPFAKEGTPFRISYGFTSGVH